MWTEIWFIWMGVWRRMYFTHHRFHFPAVSSICSLLFNHGLLAVLHKFLCSRTSNRAFTKPLTLALFKALHVMFYSHYEVLLPYKFWGVPVIAHLVQPGNLDAFLEVPKWFLECYNARKAFGMALYGEVH